jgi:hypothetical protein
MSKAQMARITVERARKAQRVILIAVLFFALLAWVALLCFTYYVYPATTNDFFVFFLLLLVALTCTLSPAIYLIGTRLFFSRTHRMTILQAICQGGIIALAVVLNLILRSLHSWNLIMAVVIVVAATVVEIIFMARKG